MQAFFEQGEEWVFTGEAHTDGTMFASHLVPSNEQIQRAEDEHKRRHSIADAQCKSSGDKQRNNKRKTEDVTTADNDAPERKRKKRARKAIIQQARGRTLF